MVSQFKTSSELIGGVITSRYCLWSCANSPISVIPLNKFESNTVPGSGPCRYVSVTSNWVHPPGNPWENFFERANPDHPGKFFCLIPCPGAKNDGRIPGGGTKFSQTRRNCSLSLPKNPLKIEKTMRQYNFFIWRT